MSALDPEKCWRFDNIWTRRKNTYVWCCLMHSFGRRHWAAAGWRAPRLAWPRPRPPSWRTLILRPASSSPCSSPQLTTAKVKELGLLSFEDEWSANENFKAVLRIRCKALLQIRCKAVLRIRIRMFLGLHDPHPDPWVRVTDPRIRIRTKMSRIRNTAVKNKSW